MTLTRVIRAAVLLLAALSLSACSSDNEVRQPGLGQVALNLARARIGNKDVEQAGAQAAPQVTRAQMEALGRPVVFVAIPRLGTGLPAVEVARNRAFRTYMGADQATVTLKDGIVTATRGLPVDLITQELSLEPPALFSGDFPKTYSRAQRHLTGAGELVTREYACAIAPEPENQTLEIFGQTQRVREFTELCRNKSRAFKNSYWVSQDGTVWQSHQSVSKEVGHVIVQRVIP